MLNCVHLTGSSNVCSLPGIAKACELSWSLCITNRIPTYSNCRSSTIALQQIFSGLFADDVFFMQVQHFFFYFICLLMPTTKVRVHLHTMLTCSYNCSCISKTSSYPAVSETSKVSISILTKRCEVILGQFLADENDLGIFQNRWWFNLELPFIVTLLHH